MAILKKRIGELLLEADVIDEHQLAAALGYQRQWGGKLGQALVDLKLASEPQIVDALAKKLGYPVVHLATVDRAVLEPVLKLLPREVARQHNVIPISADASSITIAMADPTNVRVVDEVSFRTGKRVKIAIAGDREVTRTVDRVYFPEEAPGSRAVDLAGSAARAGSRSYDELPDQAQQRYFQSTMRDLESAPPPREAPRPPEVAGAVPAGSPAAAPTPAAPAPASREAALRDAIERMATVGDEAGGGLRGARLAAAMARALLRRGLVTEAELLAELMKTQK